MNFTDKPFKSNLAAGRKHDQILSKILEKSTRQLLQSVPIQKGMYGLDLGCGMGTVTFELSAIVGQAGKISAIDPNVTNVSIAQEKAVLANQTTIEFYHQSISEWDEANKYDFVYSRLLFNRLTAPSQVMNQIFRSLKKGGVAIIEDMDVSNYNCYPSFYAFERYAELVSELRHRKGTNANIGNQLNFLFQQSNFAHTQAQLVRPTFLNTESKRIPSLTLENMAAELLEEKLITTAELQALLFELNAFEKRQDTMISLPAIYQVVGYKL